MKSSLFTTLLALTSMTLMVMTVSSSGLRGLQSVNVQDVAASIPSFKLTGVANLLQILNSASDFTNSTFDVITLDSFSQNVTDQGVVYEGKVTVANDQGVNITGLVTGTWDSANNNVILTASQYQVDTENSDSDGQSDISDDNSDEANNNSTTADGFTVLDINVAQSDPNIVAAFEFSQQKLIETGEAQNKIPLSDYNVTEWSYASYKNKSNGVYYKFVAKLLGANYVNVDTNMTTFRYNNQTLFLAGYYYHAYNISKDAIYNNSTQPDNNNTNATVPTDNSTLPVDNSTIPDNSTQPVDNSTQPIDNSTLPVDNSTVPDNSTQPVDNSTIPDNSTLPVDNSTQPIDNSTLPFDNNATLPVDSNNTNSTNNTTPTTPVPAVPANYTYISPEDLANNSVAQSALAFGINALVQKGVSEYKIPAASAEYNVTKLILAAYKNTSTGNSFVFYTNLTNALKYKLDANITVQYRASNSSYKLAGYSFHSYGYPASVIVIPSTQNNTSNSTNNSTGNNSTQPVVNNTQPADNSTVPVDNSTVPDNTTQPVVNSTIPDNSTQPVNNNTQPVVNNSSSNATQPANNNTAPVSNNTAPQVTSDGYTIYTANQFANDSLAQSAVKYGAQALIEKALSQNKIPAANANYTITNVVLASYKKQVIGTSYKFVVNLTNVDHVKVDANLTVFYRYSNKALSLNGYAFRSYNYSHNAIGNNTNSSNSTSVVPPVSNTTSPSNSTVVAQNNNSTVIDTGATSADNSTVVSPAAPVSASNATVIDDGSAIANATANAN